MNLRVYVAGASGDMEPARRAMALVRESGAVITEDWIAAIEAAGSANDVVGDPEGAKHAALADLEAVRTADVVWVVTPSEKEHGCGLWVELGAAIAHGVPVVISGPQADRSIFAALCQRCGTETEALAAVLAHGDKS